ncbi:MAG: hypothetical protein K2M08_04910 [Anaeroplasmataceae bacterium]|nr:hypothetical protein [Anaeroplasmataceae bacterium]MDE6241747.1 hypothetical protein [Anaeroplasmataceae bacterium]
MKKLKFILAIVLLGVVVLGTAKLIPATSKSMDSDPGYKIGDFDDEGVYTFSHQPCTQDK